MSPYVYAVYWLPPASSAFLLARKCNWLAEKMLITCVMRHARLQKLQRFRRKMPFYSFLILWLCPVMPLLKCHNRSNFDPCPTWTKSFIAAETKFANCGAIFSVIYNILLPNFEILLVSRCSFSCSERFCSFAWSKSVALSVARTNNLKSGTFLHFLNLIYSFLHVFYFIIGITNSWHTHCEVYTGFKLVVYYLQFVNVNSLFVIAKSPMLQMFGKNNLH